MRVKLRVKPGASRGAVGGRHGDALVRAVEGKATEAVLRAVADAFAVPRRDVVLVTGRTSRDKIVDISGVPDDLGRRLATLLGG